MAGPYTLARTARRNCSFWKLWEKFFYLTAAVLFAFLCWASNEYGGLALLRSGCGFFAVIGLGSLAYAWRLSVQARATTSWLPVEARIIKSEVVSDREPGAPPITYSFPRVTYQYEVQGQTYTSGNVVLADVNYSSGDAGAIVERYPAGARVMAWVDPADPHTAVLEPGIAGRRREYAVPTIVGCVFTVFGAAAWFLIPVLAR